MTDRPPSLADWRAVADRAAALVKAATHDVTRLRAASWLLPRVRHHIFLNPEGGDVHVCLDKVATDSQAAAWESTLRDLGYGKLTGGPTDRPPPGYGVAPWVVVKQASDPVVSALARLLNYQPSSVNQVVGGPSPLAAALASGVFGAGLGYLGGTAAEAVLPEKYFTPGVLRRNAALAGGAAGTLPALLWGLSSQQANPDKPGLRAWTSGWPFRPQDATGPAALRKAAASLVEVLGVDPGEYLVKTASPLGTGLDLLALMPAIPRDEFGQSVWRDDNTPVPIRAATVGLVNTASAAAGGRPSLSPLDIARVSDSAVRGLLVGKTLGTLAGLTPQAQADLQAAGVWGSILTSVIPNAFPNPAWIFGR